jgi:hypothetical protein
VKYNEVLTRKNQISSLGISESTKIKELQDREASLKTQVSELSLRMDKAIAEHDDLLGEYKTLSSLESQHLTLIGKSRALGFLVSELTERKLRLSGQLADLNEHNLKTQLDTAQRSYQQVQNQIAVAEKHLADLMAIKNQPIPTFSDLDSLKADCANLETEIRNLSLQLPSQKAYTADSGDIAELRKEAKSKIEQLINSLKSLEEHQSKVCEAKMDSLSHMIELEEKRLYLFHLRRELFGLIGDDTRSSMGMKLMDGLVDFESRDVDFERKRLSYAHEDLQACEQKRISINERISQLQHVLDHIPCCNS